jgi:hypothetical protein
MQVANYSLQQLHILPMMNDVVVKSSKNNVVTSVLDLFNRAKTVMGRQLLRKLLLQPICDPVMLTKNYEQTERWMQKLNENDGLVKKLRDALGRISNIPRIMTSLLSGKYKLLYLRHLVHSVTVFQQEILPMLESVDLISELKHEESCEDCLLQTQEIHDWFTSIFPSSFGNLDSNETNVVETTRVTNVCPFSPSINKDLQHDHLIWTEAAARLSEIRDALNVYFFNTASAGQQPPGCFQIHQTSTRVQIFCSVYRANLASRKPTGEFPVTFTGKQID